MFKAITSAHNPIIKLVLELKKKSQKDLALVEGTPIIERALKAGFVFTHLLFDENANIKPYQKIFNTLKKQAEICSVSSQLFFKLTFGDTKEDVIGICKTKYLSLNDLGKGAPFFVVLESLEKPGNLGAILRTADAAGVSGVIVCQPQTHIYNPNVIYASRGAVFSIPVVVCSNEEARNFFEEEKIHTYGTFVQAQMRYYNADLRKPCAVIMGREDKGLSSFWQKNSETQITIPMVGHIDSLNASASAAVIIYEAYRQRHT